MHIGILQFELLIRSATSLKDKRSVIKSVKDRLHREHLVSVAEVEYLDNMSVAGMALALVNRDQAHVNQVLDVIVGKLRRLTEAELGECYREVLSGQQLPTSFQTEDGQPLWTEGERREAGSGEAL